MMNRTTTLKPRSTFHSTVNLKGMTKSMASNWRLILLTSLFVLGFFIGTLLIRSDAGAKDASTLSQIVDGFIGARSNQSPIPTFANSLLGMLPFFLGAFFLGMSSIGVLLVPVVPFFRGLGLGYSLGYLYAMYAVKGISYAALLIIPHTVIATIALLFACRESMRLSGMMFCAMLPSGEPVKFWPEFRKYALRFIAFFVLILISALLDTLFSIAFLRFFSF